MKRKLLKSLLAIAMLCAGSGSAWAENMTTMTGLLGLTDNSNGFNAYATKVITIAAGESYQYTFVNYNKGNEGTDIWENWTVEGRRSDNSHCFDFRADGGFWTWKPDADADVLNASYTGSTNTSISKNTQEWLSAYNGVTVTLTISRSNDGDVITVEHSATTNTAVSYSGTFTCSGFGTGDATFIITNEDSHQVINKVVYTEADDKGGTIDLACDHTASVCWGSNNGFNNVDGETAHFNNDTGSGWSGAAFATFSLGDLPDGVTISSAKMLWHGTSGKGYGSVIYYLNSGQTFDFSSAQSQGTVAQYSGNKTKVADISTNLSQVHDVETNVITAIQSIYGADQDYVIFQWTGNQGAADLYGRGSTSLAAPTLEISYTKETTYTATFTETNSLTPIVTIYSDSERTAEVANGTLTNDTYYYTASLAGYYDYKGSFTVDGAAPSISFTMTAKNVFNYSVNAVDGESGIIKANIISGSCYEDESVAYYLPECVLVNGTLHFMAAEQSYKSENVTSNNQVFSYPYTTAAVNNVVFFVEGESISGALTSISDGNQRLASNGQMGRGSNLNVTTLPAGNYAIYVRYVNTNKDDHNVTIKAGETEVFNKGFSGRGTQSSEFSLSEDAILTLTALGSSKSGVDYVYIVRTGVPVTLGSLGWATLYTPYALNFDGTGLTAYTASVDGTTVTLTKVSDVPANTGVVLNGTAGSYNIPTIASSETAKGDLKGNATESTAFDAVTGHTYYVLAQAEDYPTHKVQFCPVTSGSIAAGKAFLDIASGVSVKTFNVVFNDATGIHAMENETSAIENAPIFNLAGQRMSQLKRGVNIVNGKKVLVK